MHDTLSLTNKSLINLNSWLLCNSTRLVSIPLRTSSYGNRRDNVPIKMCTGLHFTIQPERSKATLNGPFHGMIHLQTPCPPATSNLIIQALLIFFSLCLAGVLLILLIYSSTVGSHSYGCVPTEFIQNICRTKNIYIYIIYLFKDILSRSNSSKPYAIIFSLSFIRIKNNM